MQVEFNTNSGSANVRQRNKEKRNARKRLEPEAKYSAAQAVSGWNTLLIWTEIVEGR